MLGGKPLTANRASLVLRMFLLACLALPAAAATPLQGIDAEREEARMERDFKRAPAAEAYLQGIVDRIIKTAPQALPVPLRLRAVQARNPFVFCLGNGAVYVSTGLVARLANDSQVAALIAPEITGSFAPNQALQAQFDEKNGKHLGAKLLAVIATAGIATFPIVNAENKAMTAQADALVVDNDTTAAAWLRRAGFDPSQCPAAAARLQEQLGAEKQFGLSRLSSDSGLKLRAEQFTRALAALPAETTPTPRVPDDPDTLRKIAHQLSLEMAYDYVNNNQPEAFEATVARIEKEHGADTRTACLRAEHVRTLPTSSTPPASVIEAYEKCAASPDASAIFLRELAFLYRDAGNDAAAIRNFETYLKRKPSAVDAPIIKMYIEELRGAKPQ
jgi:hypothetical protein